MTSIGVFDSGIGGLSILREIRWQHPTLDVVYVADQGYAPYGERSLEEVRGRAFAITRYLLERGVSAVVVACNSASAAALRELRLAFPEIPFVGMEPAVKPAAARSERRVVGVLATTATFQGELYASVVDRHASGVEVIAVPAPGLAAAIEDGDDLLVARLLDEYLTPLRDARIDRLVLGCTHYPFIRDLIEERLGPDVELVDPSAPVARQVGRVVDVPLSGAGELEMVTTGDVGRFSAQVDRLAGFPSTAVGAVI